MCAIAAGWCELNFEWVLQPWDYAAVSLILEEAGGRISRIDGKPLDIYAPCPVVAGNPKAYETFFAEHLSEL